MQSFIFCSSLSAWCWKLVHCWMNNRAKELIQSHFNLLCYILSPFPAPLWVMMRKVMLLDCIIILHRRFRRRAWAGTPCETGTFSSCKWQFQYFISINTHKVEWFIRSRLTFFSICLLSDYEKGYTSWCHNHSSSLFSSSIVMRHSIVVRHMWDWYVFCM